jgi:alkanesulfonate monooxygenase SsuD/methylene tetrahydromethanopterin reductase-like flavin-dependent oxidoreductase (luciferase family)
MWTEKEPFDFDGKFYQLTGAICEPKPVQKPHPPIMIGGGGEKSTLRVVAEHADIWNCPARSAEEFQQKSKVLDEHCAAIGRDPGAITRSMQVLIRGGEDAAAVRDRLQSLIEVGVTHLVLAPIPPLPSVAWLADEIVAPLLTNPA